MRTIDFTIPLNMPLTPGASPEVLCGALRKALSLIEKTPVEGNDRLRCVKRMADDAGFRAYRLGITRPPAPVAAEPILLEGWNVGQRAAATEDPEYIPW